MRVTDARSAAEADSRLWGELGSVIDTRLDTAVHRRLSKPVTRAAVLSKPIATPLPGADLLEDEPQQLDWRTDIVQMTRYYMIEAARSSIRLSPRRAGFPV